MKTKNIFDFRKREARDVTAKSTSKDAFKRQLDYASICSQSCAHVFLNGSQK